MQLINIWVHKVGRERLSSNRVVSMVAQGYRRTLWSHRQNSGISPRQWKEPWSTVLPGVQFNSCHQIAYCRLKGQKVKGPQELGRKQKWVNLSQDKWTKKTNYLSSTYPCEMGQNASCSSGRVRRGDTQKSLVCTISKIQWEEPAKASYLVDGENSFISTKSATWRRSSPNLCSLWSCLQFPGRYLLFHYPPWLYLRWHWKMCSSWPRNIFLTLLVVSQNLRPKDS